MSMPDSKPVSTQGKLLQSLRKAMYGEKFKQNPTPNDWVSRNWDENMVSLQYRKYTYAWLEQIGPDDWVLTVNEPHLSELSFEHAAFHAVRNRIRYVRGFMDAWRQRYGDV